MALFVLTSPSGTGKTTISQLLEKIGVWFECKSHTTRPMREGEAEGVTYYFTEKSKMNDMIENGEFAEYVIYDGHKYGITHAEIKRVTSRRKNAFIIAEYQGYKQIKKLYPNAVGIFMYMNKEECLANMLLRGDSMESALKRIATYDTEMSNRNEYDYVIRNVHGDMDGTRAVIATIVRQF